MDKNHHLIENTQKASHSAAFLVAELQAMLKDASTIESIVLLQSIEKVASVQNIIKQFEASLQTPKESAEPVSSSHYSGAVDPVHTSAATTRRDQSMRTKNGGDFFDGNEPARIQFEIYLRTLKSLSPDRIHHGFMISDDGHLPEMTDQGYMDELRKGLIGQNQSVPGLSLDIEPEAVEAIEYTYFDCWSPFGDERSSPFGDKSAQAIKIARRVLTGWAESLGLNAIEPNAISAMQMSGSFDELCRSRGAPNVLSLALPIIKKAGYSVYESDTRIEIYETFDLMLNEFDMHDKVSEEDSDNPIISTISIERSAVFK